MLKNVLNINDLSFGGKAYGLYKLNNFNVSVPVAYGIDQDSINKILAGDESTLSQLLKILSSFDKKATFAIRSSATNEDGTDKSFAGMYESVLNVPNNINSIIDAISRVNKSASSSRVTSYNKEKSQMNIVLQEMINPKIAGVCFTDAIDFDGSTSIYIEYVEGIGETLVSGKKTAKYVVVSLEDFSYRCEDESVRPLFKDLVESLKKIRTATKEALDMEWCITEDGKSYFVQARPITKQIIIRAKLAAGAVASSGYCSGPVYIIDEDLEDEEIESRIKNFPKGAVLLAKTTDTNYVPAMKKASGIITTEGSVLSHAAIIAREFGIPCITGYKEALDLFKEGHNITIDTNNQTLLYDGEKTIFGNGKEINLLELYNFDNIIEEIICDKMVLVEEVKDEFGIHIDEDLTQEQIDNIVVAIRKKYKKDPIVLADQKYLWYIEYKRYKNFPNFINSCREAMDICREFKYKELEAFVIKELEDVRSVFSLAKTDYDAVYAGEYAQAKHFLINLYMCNGCAMKAISDYMEENNISSVHTILDTDTQQSRFLKEIEKIRGSIWQVFISNGWSNDDYYDEREKRIATVIGYQNAESDSIDVFYSNLKCPQTGIKKIKI